MKQTYWQISIYQSAITFVRASLATLEVQCCKTCEQQVCLYCSQAREGKGKRDRERERASVWSHLQFKRNIGFVANKVAGFFIIVFDCKDSSRSVELDSRLWRDVVLVVVSSLLGLPIESSKESLSVSRRSLPSDVPIIPRYAIFGCSNRLSQKTVRRTTATILLCCVVLLYAIGLILCALGVFIFVPIVFLFFFFAIAMNWPNRSRFTQNDTGSVAFISMLFLLVYENYI